MADALSQAWQAWYVLLHGDSVLLNMLATDDGHTGVYKGVVAPPLKWPAVVIAPLSVRDITAQGPQRVGVNALWLIEAIVQALVIDPAQPIMDRVDTLAQSQYGQASAGALQVRASEEMEARFEIDSAGRTLWHLGRRYRVLGPAF